MQMDDDTEAFVYPLPPSLSSEVKEEGKDEEERRRSKLLKETNFCMRQLKREAYLYYGILAFLCFTAATPATIIGSSGNVGSLKAALCLWGIGLVFLWFLPWKSIIKQCVDYIKVWSETYLSSVMPRFLCVSIAIILVVLLIVVILPIDDWVGKQM